MVEDKAAAEATATEVATLRADNEALKMKLQKAEYRIMHLLRALDHYEP
jgi:hypothetical protein